MRILITGAGGFIGRNLIRHLQGRHEIVPLSRSWTDPDVLRKTLPGVEAVVHLGGIKGRDRCERQVREAIAVNVNATGSLAEAARQARVGRFLFASTYGVYGRRDPSELSSREEDELWPIDLYSLTKVLAERLLRQGMEATILRLGHVYGCDSIGPNSDVVTVFLHSALEEGIIRIRGSGRSLIDPIYIEDVCQYIQRLLESESPSPGVFNVAGGSPLTIRSLAEQIRLQVKEFGIDVRVVHEGLDDPGEFDRAASVQRIRDVVKDLAPRGLSEGLQEILTHRCQKIQALP